MTFSLFPVRRCPLRFSLSLELRSGGDVDLLLCWSSPLAAGRRESWADSGRNRWRTPSPKNFPCFFSTWCGCVACSWQQRLGDLSNPRPGTTSYCCGCSWPEEPPALPGQMDGRSGWLWARGVLLILRELGKCMLPLCTQEGRRRPGCLWKPSFLFSPWLYEIILLGQWVLKLMEGRERAVFDTDCPVWLKNTHVFVVLELARCCSRAKGKEINQMLCFPM